MTKKKLELDLKDLEIVKIDELIPYDKNPRKISQKSIRAVAASIRVSGYNQPIVCNQDNVICIGHTRWLAAKKCGLKTVVVIKQKMTNDEFVKANIQDNKSGEFSDWDENLLKENLLILGEISDEDMLEAGFSDKELHKLLDEENLNGIFEEKKPKNPILRPKLKTNVGIKTISLSYPKEEFNELSKMIEVLGASYQMESISEAVARAIEIVYYEITGGDIDLGK